MGRAGGENVEKNVFGAGRPGCEHPFLCEFLDNSELHFVSLRIRVIFFSMGKFGTALPASYPKTHPALKYYRRNGFVA
jgi:hypothetical protein